MLASFSSIFAPVLPSLIKRRPSLGVLFSAALNSRRLSSRTRFSSLVNYVSVEVVHPCRSRLKPDFIKNRSRMIFRSLCSLSSEQEIEWRDQQRQQINSYSEDDGYTEHLLEVQQEKQSRFVPVKAYFISTRFNIDFSCCFQSSILHIYCVIPFLGSIDLRGLQAQNSFNVVPPTSRATNYVVLRYYDGKSSPQVSSLLFCFFFCALYMLIWIELFI